MVFDGGSDPQLYRPHLAIETGQQYGCAGLKTEMQRLREIKSKFVHFH